MLRPLTHIALVVSLGISAFGAPQHQKTQRPKKSALAAQAVPQAAPQQQLPPPPPPTPEQGPSSPPEVTLRGGQLTILARNSTLGDVLNAVRTKTGASVDMPAVASERVAGQFGPGAPRDVLAQLLNGSHFDYVLVGSPTDPGSLKKVVLTARASGPEPAPAPQNNQPQAYNQGFQPAPQMEPDQNTDDNSPDVQQEPPPPIEQEEPQGEQPPQPPNGGPVVKTPEQLLRELQQQQQQQQQQNPQPPQQQ